MSNIAAFATSLVAFSMLFSGCVAPWSAEAADEASAMDLLTAAKQYSTAPGELLAVFTLETAAGAEFAGRSPPGWLLPFLNLTDGNVGNGLAPAWGYYFGDPMMTAAGEGDGHTHEGGDSALVIVGADKKILWRGMVPMDFPIKPAAPLGSNWTIDSDEAALNARDSDWVAAVGGDGAYGFAALAERIGSPAAWIFEAGEAQSGEGATVAADARDGLKIRLGNRDPFAPVKTESGTISGTATTSPTSSTFKIEWPSHREIEFYLDIANGGGGVTQTGAQLEFVAKGPGGQEFPFHWDGSGGTNQAWFQFEAPNPGSWTVEARVVADATTREPSQAFTVQWCALGATRC